MQEERSLRLKELRPQHQIILFKESPAVDGLKVRAELKSAISQHSSEEDNMLWSVLEGGSVGVRVRIRQYIEGQGPKVVFSWQAGEPTLLGVDFCVKVVELQKKYQRANQRIENDPQTNGTLLSDEWAKFLYQHNFLVGPSFDGPRALRDAFRVAKDGSAAFEKVFAASQSLHKRHVAFSTLTVVNSVNTKCPLDVYRFLRRFWTHIDLCMQEIISRVPGEQSPCPV